MDFSGAGTAIMLALAAVLWFLYLLPTWVRRREYLATERNATRLQRAIRVMAETAELPDEVRLEASAREAAQREKLLRQEQRRTDAVARAEVTAAAARARAAEARAAEIERAAHAVTVTAERVVRQAPVAVAVAPSGLERLRRARRVAGLLLLASVVVGAVQAWLMVTTGAVLGSWVVLAGCAAGAGISLSLQRRIVARSRSLAPAMSARVVRRTSSTLIDAEAVAEPVREWTPVPIPKPLYLEHQQAPRVPVAPSVSAEELLKAAAVEAERALAAAHAEPEVVPFPVRPAPQAAPAPVAAPSRYASMGIVDSASGAMPDLDEVLRRRRSG
jgi:hypothetical protein